MTKAFVLVRNIRSTARCLDFGDFTIGVVGLRFKELREVFSSVDVNREDWILEKSYAEPLSGPPASVVGGDIEDTLLLFRLYKAGDIAFIKMATAASTGSTVQFPYRAMNELNSYALLKFDIGSEDCATWRQFATCIRENPSWTSDWFGVARRFFLIGGAKRFNPNFDEVDRIVDYGTALEAALVPEKDYNTRRISRRAAVLIAPNDAEQAERIVKFVKKFYEIRSRIVHGTKLGDEAREWLGQHGEDLERRVRQVLVAAVQRLPAGEEERRAVLAGLYDPTDDDRGEFALQKFQEIKTTEVQQAIAAKIARKAKII